MRVCVYARSFTSSPENPNTASVSRCARTGTSTQELCCGHLVRDQQSQVHTAISLTLRSPRLSLSTQRVSAASYSSCHFLTISIHRSMADSSDTSCHCTTTCSVNPPPSVGAAQPSSSEQQQNQRSNPESDAHPTNLQASDSRLLRLLKTRSSSTIQRQPTQGAATPPLSLRGIHQSLAAHLQNRTSPRRANKSAANSSSPKSPDASDPSAQPNNFSPLSFSARASKITPLAPTALSPPRARLDILRT